MSKILFQPAHLQDYMDHPVYIMMLSSSKLLPMFFLVFLSQSWQVALASSNLRCYPELVCGGSQISVPHTSNGSSCCLGTSRGLTFDFGGNDEICHNCLVLGWMSTEIYVIGNSEQEILFGTLKGSLVSRAKFSVEYVSNSANMTLVSSPSALVFTSGSNIISVTVQVPRYDGAIADRTTTLTMIRELPVTLLQGMFVQPEVTLQVIVPRVEFELSSYSLQFPNTTLPLCLTYSNTAEGAYAQFSVGINITQQGEGIPIERGFNFTRESGRACRPIPLPVSAIDALQDTVFSLEMAPPEAGFELGSQRTATVTVEAFDPPHLQFQRVSYSTVFPTSAVTVCLVTAPDTVYLPFEAEVTLTKQTGSSEPLQAYMYPFNSSTTVSCQDIVLPHLTLERFTDTVFTASITTPQEPVFQRGDIAMATITVIGGSSSGSGKMEDGSGEKEDGGDKDEDVVEDVETVGEDAYDLHVDLSSVKEGSSDDSGTPPWAIAIAVTIPVLVVILVVALVGGLMYNYNHYTSYKCNGKLV